MAKKIEYLVVNKCYHERKLYRKGEVVTFLEGENVPKHFTPVGEVKPVEVAQGRPYGKSVKVNNKDTTS